MARTGLSVTAILPPRFRDDLINYELRKANLKAMDSLWMECVKITSKWRHRVNWIRTQRETYGYLLAEVYTEDKIFGYVEKGTKPHKIPKRPGKTLKFYWRNGPKGAGNYYYRSVWHPGSKAQNKLDEVQRTWKRTYRKIYEQAMILAAEKSGHSIRVTQ